MQTNGKWIHSIEMKEILHHWKIKEKTVSDYYYYYC